MSSEDIIQTLKYVLDNQDAKLSKDDYAKLVKHCDSFLEKNDLVLTGIPDFATELEIRDANSPHKYTFKHEKLEDGSIKVSIFTFVRLVEIRRAGLTGLGLEFLLNSTPEDVRAQKFNEGNCLSKRAENGVSTKGVVRAMVGPYTELEIHYVCCNILRTLTPESIVYLKTIRDECIIIDKMLKCLYNKREGFYEINHMPNYEYASLVYMLDILLDIDAFNTRLDEEFNRMLILCPRLRPMPKYKPTTPFLESVVNTLVTILFGRGADNNKRQRLE